MALVYPDKRRPTLRYNFTAGKACNEPKYSHRQGASCNRALPKDVVLGTIRTKGEV